MGHPISQQWVFGWGIPPSNSARLGPPALGFVLVFVIPYLSKQVGATQYPDSFSLNGRSGVNRPQHTPFSIEPQRGQVSENPSKPSRSEHWGVFHEDVLGSNLANDPGKLAPKPGTFTVNSGSLARCADVLAGSREPATNDEFPLHLLCSGKETSTFWVVGSERFNIVPNGKYW
jgi:hypothetical protein